MDEHLVICTSCKGEFDPEDMGMIGEYCLDCAEELLDSAGEGDSGVCLEDAYALVDKIEDMARQVTEAHREKPGCVAVSKIAIDDQWFEISLKCIDAPEAEK